jgi:tetratricopeptide (TPR) repeat protein
LRELGRFEEALASYTAALTMKQDYVTCMVNRASLLLILGLNDLAETDLLAALKLDPINAQARFLISGILLSRGECLKGWKFFESRSNTILGSHWYRVYSKNKRWDESNILTSGSTLLLYTEQGLGDVIQFSRFIPILINHNVSLVIQAPKSLHRLFAEGFNGVKFVDSVGAYQGKYDFHCSLLSIPALLGQSTIPTEPWLGKSIQRQNVNKLSRPTVGLVWRGSRGRDIDRYKTTCRNLPIDLLKELTGLACNFISLQLDVEPFETEYLEAFGIDVLDQKIEDFYHTAQILKGIDLLITIDTSIVHLAGSLGIECMVLLPKVTDYRWCEFKGALRWYPKIRPIRQEIAGSWTAPIKILKRAIQAKFGLQGPCATMRK